MKRIRTSARLNNYRNKDASQISPARKQGNVDEDDENYSEGDGGSDYSPENADSSVPCPSCQKRMKAWQVFKHLEKCPGPLPDSRTNEFLPAERSRQTWQPRVPVTLERLPALNYSILKEQTLRKKLAELGISNQGPRPILERRHKEWITLWNANCDSVLPKKKYQLLQDLDIWEKTQGHRTTPMAKTNSIGVTIKDKNFDGAAWAAKHESSFKNLITNARRGRLEARGPEEDTSSPTEQRAGNHFPHLTHDSTVNFEGADQVPLGLRSEAKQEDLDIASSKSNPMEEVVRLHASSTPVAMSLADVGTLESESPASNSSETHLGGG
ncbi:E3 ubiquitin-protein ligase rad18 [Metarhizium rileyi]|uniref:E3 ubiquitin-protein ligase rad18 n=1 Tax=Metarhizium rileyi (strain RCEF 4871) TaxID=1649241 RepID=A0A5C6GPH7_METRR|nr:E3 ubiquitin-protein ligase rad18 [Metarhizium rileyi]